MVNRRTVRLFRAVGRATAARRTPGTHAHVTAARVASGARSRLAGADQVDGGGAKKHRLLPSGRLQRQNSPSGEGWASLKGMDS